jgi:Mor family transcriptional regulator
MAMSERNREMLAAYEVGRTVEQLSKDYGLSRSSIGSILTGERHRRRLSPEPFYRSFREAGSFQ